MSMRIMGADLLLFLLVLCATPALSAADSDNDGLSDDLEQELLQKFVPRFMLSPTDCDGAPAEFGQGMHNPRATGRNGTIYGQVFPSILPLRTGSFIEIHFYHLWNRDCGPNPHALDVEHVSALVSSPHALAPASLWRAEYWYAAAHEDTICDASHAVRSSFLKAERQGPTIWISAGKHASFLSQELCRGGCGGDDCSSVVPLSLSKIINLGEVNAPANGALWVTWPGWQLANKMRATDLPERVLVKLDEPNPPSIVPINESLAPVKKAILVSASTADALTSADHKTDAALSASASVVGKSAKTSAGKTGSALHRAGHAVWRILHGSTEKKDSQ
jgi:hypothetical protein